MKRSLQRLVVSLIAGGLFFAAANAEGIDYYRSSVAAQLQAVTAWTNGVGSPSTAADRAIWDTPCTAGSSYNLYAPSSKTWGQIVIRSPYADISFAGVNASSLILAGIDSLGIDLSQATRNLTINNGAVGSSLDLFLSNSQTFTVAAGRTLTLSTRTLNITNNTLTCDGSGGQVINAPLAGSGSLIKNGSGTLTLAATNQHTGGITLNTGLLNIHHSGALGIGGKLTLAGGRLDNATAADIAVVTTNDMEWTGNLTFIGTKSLDLGNGAVNLGATPKTVAVSNNTLTVNGVVSGSSGLNALDILKEGVGTLTLGGNLALRNDQTNTVNGGVLNIAGTIADAANTYGLTKDGPGSLKLSGSNAYDGVTLVSTGVLVIANNYALGSTNGETIVARKGAQLQVSGTVTTEEPITLNGDTALSVNSGNKGVFTGPITLASSASIITDGTGQCELNGTITCAAGTNPNLTFSGGSASVAVNGCIDSLGAGQLSRINGGTLYLNNLNTFTGAVQITLGTLVANTCTHAGVASSLGRATGTSSIIKLDNNGTLKYVGNATATDRQVKLGTTANAQGGVINASGAGPIAFTAPIFNNPTTAATNSRLLKLSGANTDDNMISGAIVDNATALGGTISVLKDGTGTWVLAGTNTYSGSTIVTNGLLKLAQTQALSSSHDVYIYAPAKVQLCEGIHLIRNLYIDGVRQYRNAPLGAKDRPSALSGLGVFLPTQGEIRKGTLIRVL